MAAAVAGWPRSLIIYLEEIMTEIKEKPAKVLQEKARAKLKHRVPTYRTVLVAASVGVLIGLLLRR